MVTLRIPQSQWTPFAEALCVRRDVESAGVVLAERLRGGQALLARHLLPVPDDGYLVRRRDQLRIDPLALNRLIRPARDRAMSVLTVHTHPGSTHPWFSEADDTGDSRLMPSLFAQMPGPHGSIVIAGDTREPSARLWSEPGNTVDLTVRIVGKMVRTYTTEPRTLSEPWFDRQSLALGDAGQRILRGLNVAVVGLGGTGSVAFVQLAHLGVGRITVIDGDRVEDSNVSRIIGATTQDAGTTKKVDLAAPLRGKSGSRHARGSHARAPGNGRCCHECRGFRHRAFLCRPPSASRTPEPPRVCAGNSGHRHGKRFSRGCDRSCHGWRWPCRHCRSRSPMPCMLGPYRSESTPDRIAAGGSTRWSSRRGLCRRCRHPPTQRRGVQYRCCRCRCRGVDTAGDSLRRRGRSAHASRLRFRDRSCSQERTATRRSLYDLLAPEPGTSEKANQRYRRGTRLTRR